MAESKHFTLDRTQPALAQLKDLVAMPERGPAFVRLTDTRLKKIEAGRALLHSTPGPQHGNAHGRAHGGYAATLLDSALGMAVMATLEIGEFHVTTDLSVKFMRAVPLDGTLLLTEGKVVHRGRRLAVADGSIVDDAGKLYAHATASFMIYREEG